MCFTHPWCVRWYTHRHIYTEPCVLHIHGALGGTHIDISTLNHVFYTSRVRALGGTHIEPSHEAAYYTGQLDLLCLITEAGAPGQDTKMKSLCRCVNMYCNTVQFHTFIIMKETG